MTSRSILAGVAVLALSGLVAAPAQAATEHCEGHSAPGSGKVETGGAGNSVATDLADGTAVCVKAGTEVTTVTVVGGRITQTAITNKKGKPLGISYYVPADPGVPGGGDPGEEEPGDGGPCDPVCPV
jgi:hypothetical protein